MLIDFRLEYWIDDGWYVGHFKDVPGVLLEQVCNLLRHVFPEKKTNKIHPSQGKKKDHNGSKPKKAKSANHNRV